MLALFKWYYILIVSWYFIYNSLLTVISRSLLHIEPFIHLDSLQFTKLQNWKSTHDLRGRGLTELCKSRNTWVSLYCICSPSTKTVFVISSTKQFCKFVDFHDLSSFEKHSMENTDKYVIYILSHCPKVETLWLVWVGYMQFFVWPVIVYIMFWYDVHVQFRFFEGSCVDVNDIIL